MIFYMPFVMSATVLCCDHVVGAFVRVVRVVNHEHARTNKLSYSPQSTSAIDISENALRDVTPLKEWAANYGVQMSDCYELNSDDGGYDVYATTTQNLPQDSPILYIPSEIILTGNKACQELGVMSSAEQSLMSSDHNTFYLFLKVLKEYEMGQDSTYYPWLNSSPRYYSNGASMTDFCFGCLPPYAAEMALDEKKRLGQFVQALHAVPFLSEESKNNADLTRWAYNVVYTRMMMMPDGDYCLCPMADYFNHIGGDVVDASITFDEEGNCYAYSTRNLQAGQSLLICYGDSTNPSYLMAKYGFLDESSPATFCKYVISNPSNELYNMGYPTQMLFYMDGSICDTVWDILLYEELGKVSYEEAQTFYQCVMSGDDATKQNYHSQYFVRTLESLKEHVDFIVEELDELGLGLETQMAQGQDAIRHPRLPLILKHNEFVLETFERVQQKLDNMIS